MTNMTALLDNANAACIDLGSHGDDSHVEVTLTWESRIMYPAWFRVDLATAQMKS
jgi:hypothetical protein